MVTKKCRCCGIEKETTSFTPSLATGERFGVMGICKSCRNDKLKAPMLPIPDLPKEIWKDIEGYERVYQVSNFGRVKSVTRTLINKSGIQYRINQKIKKQYIGKVGYWVVNLYSENIGKLLSVHRLIATAFIPTNDYKKHINHINGNRMDNRIENLEWVTQRENNTHMWAKKSRSSKMTGVQKNNKKSGTWYAQIRLNEKNVYLGSYNTEKEAHEAYLKALKDSGLDNKYA